MTILVTGARGFIGRHLSASLAADGKSVVGIGRGCWPADDARGAGVACWHEGEIDRDGLDRIFTPKSLEVVYHLAGGSSVGPSLAAPLNDFHDTVQTAACLAEWMRTKAPDARLVLVSSAAVYGDCGDHAIAETVPSIPLSPYGAHKAMSETLVANRGHSFGLAASIVRLFSVYGPGLTKQLMWDICCRCAAGREVAVGSTGAERRDWIHVSDAVALLRHASRLTATTTTIFNGGTGRGTTVRAAVDLLCATWGDGRFAVFDGCDRPGNPSSLVADMTLARASGFDARVDLAAGVHEYVDWFKHQ
jgi:UDP-glucose 4-epimerase